MLRLRENATRGIFEEDDDVLENGRGSRYFSSLRREMEEENSIWGQSQPPNSPTVRGASRASRASQLNRRSSVTRENLLNPLRQDLQPFSLQSNFAQNLAEDPVLRSMKLGLSGRSTETKIQSKTQNQKKSVKFVGEEEKVPPGFQWVEIEIVDAKNLKET